MAPTVSPWIATWPDRHFGGLCREVRDKDNEADGEGYAEVNADVKFDDNAVEGFTNSQKMMMSKVAGLYNGKMYG